ncbi:VOC family protein [Rhizobiales bacterium]|uniref:VOC family protein n=1 Tax=Hongsoonwoonella zoysiae TaxID=2821844 RepID=UPI00155FAF0F|nr:VOC family protein [Hongsoonwoonella zoysiae]NRG19439.1 VOC family protein [Hongsoonwoonella zoysiae]
MEQRISLITLGVDDIAEARRFFEDGLGWRPTPFDSDEVAFYQTGSCVLGLFGREDLAKDAGVSPEGSGFTPFSIAWNGRSEAEVDAAFAKAVNAGAEAVKHPEKVFWGGYSGYVRIPGGHLMEIAYNPFWEMGEDGAIKLPPPAES